MPYRLYTPLLPCSCLSTKYNTFCSHIGNPSNSRHVHTHFYFHFYLDFLFLLFVSGQHTRGRAGERLKGELEIEEHLYRFSINRTHFYFLWTRSILTIRVYLHAVKVRAEWLVISFLAHRTRCCAQLCSCQKNNTRNIWIPDDALLRTQEILYRVGIKIFRGFTSCLFSIVFLARGRRTSPIQLSPQTDWTTKNLLNENIFLEERLSVGPLSPARHWAPRQTAETNKIRKINTWDCPAKLKTNSGGLCPPLAGLNH